MADDPHPAHGSEAIEGQHLTIADAAAYLDAVVDRANRQRIETHLARCDDCLAELVAAFLLLRRNPE